MHPTTPRQPERAVIIDDDPEVRTLHRQVLEQVGLECVVTTNATDGVEAVRSFAPVITLLDVSMPGMDGFAAARLIREFSTTHLVMVSALDAEIDLVQGLDAGADDYVHKPFRPRELRARVEAALRRHRATPDPRPDAEAVATPVSEPGLWSVGSSSTAPVTTPQSPHAPAAVPMVVTPPPLTAGATALAVVPTLARPLSHGTLTLDPDTAIVSVNGESLRLEPEESAILATLLESGHRVRSTANLVLSLRGESYVTTYFVDETDKREVREHVENLKRRLGDTDPTPKWIESVGVTGYRMTSP